MAEDRDGVTESHSPSQLLKVSARQQAAIGALLEGANDTEAAKRAGVRRETVNRWRQYHPAFIAEYSSRRLELQEEFRSRMQRNLARSLEIIESKLDDGDLNVAMSIHRQYAEVFRQLLLSPIGPTDTRDIIRARARRLSSEILVMESQGGERWDQLSLLALESISDDLAGRNRL